VAVADRREAAVEPLAVAQVRHLVRLPPDCNQ